MKKRLYDFSKFNAIIVILAYAFLLTFTIFLIFDSEKTNWVAIVITILLVISLGLILWYYVYLAVTISEKGVKHGDKFIDKKDVKWKVEYNRRFKINEIIFYNKYDSNKKLSKKERKKKEIVVQYFPKYEDIINRFIVDEKKKEGQKDEEKD